MDQELLKVARLHSEAVKIVARALQDMESPRFVGSEFEHNATAIIARLAHANILLERWEDGQKSDAIRDKAIELLRAIDYRLDGAKHILQDVTESLRIELGISAEELRGEA